MSRVLYVDEACPSSRAVWMACVAAGVGVEVKKLDMLDQMEHLEEWYRQINPKQIVPTLDDGGFYLWEAHAIMRYIVDAYSSNETLYPKDPKKRAIVNQFLDYDLGVLARAVHDLTWPEIFLNQTPPKQRDIRIILTYLNDETPLAEDKYITGDHMTIADLSALAHVTFLEPIYFDVSAYPHVKDWVLKMKAMSFYQHCNIGYREWKKDIHTDEWMMKNAKRMKRYGHTVKSNPPKPPGPRTDLKNRVYAMLLRQDTIQ